MELIVLAAGIIVIHCCRYWYQERKTIKERIAARLYQGSAHF